MPISDAEISDGVAQTIEAFTESLVVYFLPEGQQPLGRFLLCNCHMSSIPRFAAPAIRVVELLAFPLVQLPNVTGPFQVFASANDHVVETGGWQPCDSMIAEWMRALAKRALPLSARVAVLVRRKQCAAPSYGYWE
jgi:hypothetical protein